MRKLKWIALAAALGSAALLLSGCSIRDVSYSIRDYFKKEASSQEETADLSIENRIFPVQVNNASGEGLEKPDGEPVTVMAVYETASGGEDRINEHGIMETYPIGQVMTYKPGDAVTDKDGNPETYAGGEAVTGVFGNALKDENEEYITRSAGEIVTHSDSDIVYDAQGRRVLSTGEPLTYEAGEYMYDTDGERIFSGVTILKDESGIAARDENGDPRISEIEIVTDAHGDPLFEEDGEVATRVLEPLLPDRVIDQAVEEGTYYIHNIASKYVYFSAPLVPAANITYPEGSGMPDPSDQMPADAGTAPEISETGEETDSEEDVVGQEDAGTDTDPEVQEEYSDGTEEILTEEEDRSGSGFFEEYPEGYMINNIQLEILGKDLPYFELRFDAEGYGYFVMQDTEQVLGFTGKPVNGANIVLQEMEKIPYPQYAYWDDPKYSLEDHQKWIIKKLKDGNYEICSAADQNYCMTVDDRNGIHYANIILWKFDDREQQKFLMQTEEPKIEKVVEEGTYYIRTGVSDWMLMSIGDFNFDDERCIYLYHSDGMDGQKFTVSYDEYGFARIAHSDSTKVLSVGNSTASDNQYVFQYEEDPDPWQDWILDPIPDDTGFVIRSALNVSEVINVMYGAAEELQPVRLYWNDNTPAQNWYFEKEAPEAPISYEAMERYAQRFYSDTGYLILVNSMTNTVGIYAGYMNNWTCIQYWDCVTGKPSTPTIKGQYTILGRIPSFDGDTDSPELYTCYYATMFYPEYYFHSIVYYAGTMDIMDDTMGWSASHGCIRLYIENAQWIYENIPDGTKVVSF